jgi:N-acetylmuramoyl-L-alanine amidase
MRRIDAIIIHCSDTPDDTKLNGRSNGDFTAQDVEAWHKERAIKEPWSHYVDSSGVARYIGYHYVVRRTGAVEAGRPESEKGCHCKGMNSSSIGVCWIGRHVMTAKQKSSLVDIIAKLCVEHGLNALDVYGHNQFSRKTCPNFNTTFTFESIDDFRNILAIAIRDIK